MPALTIGGIDLSSLGFNFTDEGHALDASVEVPQEVEIPGMRGAILAGPARTAVRAFTLKGYLDGTTQAAVRTNLRKLQALLGDGRENLIIVGDWSTVQIAAVCTRLPGLNYPTNSRANSQNEIPFAVEMDFRAANPYWQDVTPTSPTFNTVHTQIPQGTAPGEYVLLSPVGVLAACTLKGWDYLDVELWSMTLAALTAGQQYRITVQPPVMTIEKFVGGVWVFADDQKTAGVFPMLLPSNGEAFQASAWPRLSASVGTWTVSGFRRRWR